MDRAQLESVMAKNPFSNLGDAVYEVLLEEILNFDLAPGTLIVERKLAELLGVSRSPVKSAIEKLTENDYIESRDGKYYVSSFSEADFISTMDIAQLLDYFAAAEAAVKKTPRQMQTLVGLARKHQSLVRALLEGEDKPSCKEVIDADIGFHSYVVKIADNKLLSQMYEEIKFKLFRYRSYIVFSDSRRALETVENDHLRLCRLIDIGDRDIAAAGAKLHLQIARSEYKNEMSAENFNKRFD